MRAMMQGDPHSSMSGLSVGHDHPQYLHRSTTEVQTLAGGLSIGNPLTIRNGAANAVLSVEADGTLVLNPSHTQNQIKFLDAGLGLLVRDDGSDIWTEVFGGARDLHWNLPAGQEYQWQVNFSPMMILSAAQLTGLVIAVFSTVSANNVSLEGFRMQGAAGVGTAAGFGRVFRTQLMTATAGVFTSAADWETLWQDATAGSEDAQTLFKVKRGGAMTTMVTIDGLNNKVLVSPEIELDGTINHDGTLIGFYGVAPVVRSAAYTTSNVTTDRSFNADATTIDEIADVLGTLLADLTATGIIG